MRLHLVRGPPKTTNFFNQCPIVWASHRWLLPILGGTWYNSRGKFLWSDPDQDQWSEITRSMLHQMNRWISSGQGFIGSFDLPWSEWSRITDPDPDHLKVTHPRSAISVTYHLHIRVSETHLGIWNTLFICHGLLVSDWKTLLFPMVVVLLLSPCFICNHTTPLVDICGYTSE